MHQDSDQRAALPPAPILAPCRFFRHHPSFLQHPLQPVLGDLDLVLLFDPLVKVPHRKVRIDIALEPA